MDIRRTLRRPLTWIIAVPVVALIAVTAGPFVYINFIKDDPPPRISFEDLAAADESPEATDSTATTSAANTGPEVSEVSEGMDGTWSVATGSIVGYRVEEVLFGQSTEGVGRTESITGSFTLDGTTVTEASFEVDMTTFESDDTRRDNQFHGRIMSVSSFPTSTFVLTQPIDLASIPEDQVEMATTATGELTLRGTTKEVTFDLVARRNGSNIEVTGSYTIVFEEWGIPNPTNVAASTGDEGLLELGLVLSR